MREVQAIVEVVWKSDKRAGALRPVELQPSHRGMTRGDDAAPRDECASKKVGRGEIRDRGEERREGRQENTFQRGKAMKHKERVFERVRSMVECWVMYPI